jgi:hypothetical protein
MNKEMYSGDALFSIFWKLVATVLIVLILTAGGCTSYYNKIKGDILKAGVDPIKLKCLDATSTDPVCLVLVTK